jgi:hypothetical protein
MTTAPFHVEVPCGTFDIFADAFPDIARIVRQSADDAEVTIDQASAVVVRITTQAEA